MGYFNAGMLCLSLAVAACNGETPPADDSTTTDQTTPATTTTTSERAAVTGPIGAAVDASNRSESHRSRDPFRHPAATLAFFGIEPDMQVLEIWPGGSGWYTEILAPLLTGQGQLTVALIGAGHLDFENQNLAKLFTRFNGEFSAKVAADPETYGDIVVSELWAPTEITPVEAGSLDMIVTFRNLHNWLAWGQSEQVLAVFYAALRPGGLLGLTDHRSATDGEVDPQARSGYVNQDFAITTIEAAGFEFVASSEVNANPLDTRDHPAGVWTLPPTLALGDDNADHYLAIGESDRMTLLFRKPAK